MKRDQFFFASPPPFVIPNPLSLGGGGTSGRLNLNGGTSGQVFITTNATGTILSVGAGTVQGTGDISIVNSQSLGFGIAGNTSTGLITANGPVLINGLSLHVASKSGNYTALPVDDFIKCTGGVAFTITLPATPQTGKIYIVKNVTSPLATITVSSTANIDGAASQTLTTANSHITVIFDGSTYNIIG